MRPKTVIVTLLVLIALGLGFAFRGLFIWRQQSAKSPGLDATRGRRVESMSGMTMPGERKILYYQDPMHPWYKSDKPGVAPDCGMKLVPVYADEQAAQPSTSAALHLSAEKQQLIGIQTAAVEVRNLVRTIRATARLNYDETKVAHVHSKVEGWIGKVFVGYTGQLIQKGQPLFTIYSPDLLATQEEYLLALKGRQTLASSPIDGVSSGSEALLRAARRRLELWDMTDAQIRVLEEGGQPQKEITVYSTVSGFVVDRKAYDNVRVTPDLDLYTVADLSTIWAEADVFEYEASLVGTGQRAVVTLPALPGAAFAARISYIYPQLNSDTRTLRVRLDLDNPTFVLKPGMYSDVEIKIGLGRSLVVPPDAVLDSGTRQMVFLDRGNGYFQPREVELGERGDDYTVVTHGLRRGDRVVTRANFLLDSESSLRQVVSSMPEMPGMKK